MHLEIKECIFTALHIAGEIPGNNHGEIKLKVGVLDKTPTFNVFSTKSGNSHFITIEQNFHIYVGNRKQRKRSGLYHVLDN